MYQEYIEVSGACPASSIDGVYAKVGTTAGGVPFYRSSITDVYIYYDPDCDGIPSGCDNCLSAYNPTQDDTDSDGNGDVCETTCYSFCCMALTDDCMACVDCWINGGLDVNEYCLTPVADGGGLGSGYCDVPLSYVDTSQCP